MTRALRFTKHELENAARLCRAHGVAVRLTRDGEIVVFPGKANPNAIDTTEDEDLDAELAAFEAKHGNGRI